MSLDLTVRSKLPAVRRRSDVVGDVIGAFESDTVAVRVTADPTMGFMFDATKEVVVVTWLKVTV